MYHPTTRVLTVLELLQSRQRLSGAELAARLEVEPRTVRRYIQMLQDMGIPIEGERGRSGAYRLGAGFKLPPLMFSDDEALAVVLGLIAARQIGLEGAAPAVEGALAKLERVLPTLLREQVQAVRAAVAIELRQRPSLPAAGLLFTLSQAVRSRHAVQIVYRTEREVESERTIEPYGLVYRDGRWYCVGFCQLRGDRRLFRVDRMLHAEVLAIAYTPPEPFDLAAYVARSIAHMHAQYQVTIRFFAPPTEVARRFEGHFGQITPDGEGALFTGGTDSLNWFVRQVIASGLPFQIVGPEPLRREYAQLLASLQQALA